MKKLLFFVTALLISASMSFAQDITLGINDDVYTELTVGQDVFVPLIMVTKTPGYDVIGFDFFVEFDHSILQWKGSYENPLPGAINFNPLCPYSAADWTFNDYVAANALVALWQDPTYMGANFPDGSQFFTIVFTYLGGLDPGETTNLTWQTDKKLKGTDEIILEKGATAVFHQFFDYFNVTLSDGSITLLGATGTPGLWTGAVSSDWFDGANWDDGSVPVGIDVTIPAGTPNDPVIVTNDIDLNVASVANLVSDAPITIHPFGYLTVTGTFTNNASVLMLTDATDQASLICSSFAGAGTYEYDRYLGVNGGLPAEERGWHYISSPVPGFGSYNMYDYFVNTWDETTSMWMSHAGMPFPDCIPGAQIFNNGTEGWSVKFDEEYTANPGFNCSVTNPGTGMTIEYAGLPNAGTIVDGMTYTGVGLYPGFNLVGNPYPSYWYYDGFWAGPNWPTGLYDAIYYWDESANQYASYVGGIGTNGGGPYVAPAQAFFFELDGTDATVDVTFDDADRAHVYGLPYYKDAENLVKLMASANGFTDETVIRFDENMTVNRDKSDARKLLSGGSTVPSMYTMAGDVLLSVNGMPSTPSVPVYFSCQTSGTYTIEAIETSEFENVVLEDLLTGEETDLLVSGHSFNYIAGENAGRFILHFTSLGVNDNLANSINIWAANQTIYVQAPATTGDIVVYNLMGQEVVRTAIEAGVNEIPMNESNTYYIVKVLGSEVTETGKVFIK